MSEGIARCVQDDILPRITHDEKNNDTITNEQREPRDATSIQLTFQGNDVPGNDNKLQPMRSNRGARLTTLKS